ncbi:MAG TPA: hypothetical protein VF008_29540 [Niastella sp.]
MKQLRLVFTASLLFFVVMNSCSQQNTPGASSILGVFVASTPCSNGTRPLPGIAVNTDCEFIKWKLTLYQDEVTKSPTTYKLHALYGLPKQGTTGFIGGGKKIDMEGKWTIVNSTASDRHAILYQLHDMESNKTISFLKLNDNLLHLLDSEQHLMIGSAAWSYTLNRIDNK